jgi:hypothetical protein
MAFRADMVMKEVQVPPNGFCRSGHTAPKLFKREPHKPAVATKFFQISSDLDSTINGVYCEPCLIVSRAIANGQVEVRRVHRDELPAVVTLAK